MFVKIARVVPRLCPRVTDLIQNQIRYCGVRIWRNMDKVMRKMDTDNTGYLTKYELEKILAMFNIEVPSQVGGHRQVTSVIHSSSSFTGNNTQGEYRFVITANERYCSMLTSCSACQ